MDDYHIVDTHKMPTPALVVYRHIVEENIRRIGEILGGYGGLRAHIKTHKMSRVVQMEMEAGIDKFKCATPREAAMLAAAGITDILIAYPVVGAAVERVVSLRRSYPGIDLRVTADDAGALVALSDACDDDITLGVMVDLNTGMDRTGAPPGEAALALAKTIADLPGLTFDGLHVYDGHVVGVPDPEIRRQTALESVEKAVATRRLIEKEGVGVKTLVASGSPGFEFTAGVPGVDEVSPGTWVFWDNGYNTLNPGRFRFAALVLSSVISTPGPDLITLDAGSKAVAPDTPEPHFRALNLPENVEFVLRNEEHQVLRLPPGTPRPAVGDLCYLVPYHICTTVNLYDEACIINDHGAFVETWPVDARGH